VGGKTQIFSLFFFSFKRKKKLLIEWVCAHYGRYGAWSLTGHGLSIADPFNKRKKKKETKESCNNKNVKIYAHPRVATTYTLSS
jgi:uncharacterized phage-associated protein